MKKSFYEDDCFNLYQGDSIKTLKDITLMSIDMIFAGPP